MSTKILVTFCLLITVLLITDLVSAQQPTKISRIGYLGGVSPSFNAGRIEAFRQMLRELGYVEGKNIFIEWRPAEGKLDVLPALAAKSDGNGGHTIWTCDSARRNSTTVGLPRGDALTLTPNLPKSYGLG